VNVVKNVLYTSDQDTTYRKSEEAQTSWKATKAEQPEKGKHFNQELQ